MIARAALLVLAALALMAAAKAPEPVDGAWNFKTASYDTGCVMTGHLMVSPSGAGKTHACKLTAYENCPGIKITTQQNCKLAETNGAIVITSTIVHSTSANYAPDDFSLKLESAARMTGELRSADIAPVVFYRSEDAVS